MSITKSKTLFFKKTHAHSETRQMIPVYLRITELCAATILSRVNRHKKIKAATGGVYKKTVHTPLMRNAPKWSDTL